jgi:hypothetical protein
MTVSTVSTLSDKQEKAVLALLSEPSIPKAAASVGVSDRTLHRWLQDATFEAAYRKARRDAFSQAIAMTQRYAPLAVNTLAKVMTDPAAPTNAKVSAAAAVLRFGREGIELEDIETRIAALERAGSAERSAS